LEANAGWLLTQPAKRGASSSAALRVYARGRNALALAARREANAIDSRHFRRPDLAPRNARAGMPRGALRNRARIAFPYSSSHRDALRCIRSGRLRGFARAFRRVSERAATDWNDYQRERRRASSAP